MAPWRVIFFGSDRLAVPTLQALHVSPDYVVVAVCTQPPRPVGRKQVVTPNPVQLAAQELGLTVFEDVKNIVDQTVTADVGILVHFGRILPAAVLHLFPHGILNIHPSLLPAWRGPAPVEFAILHGDATVGVTVMQLASGMDTGPIIAQQVVPLPEHTLAETLYPQLFALGTTILFHALPEYLTGKIKPMPQSHANASYSKMISREDGRIFSTDLPEMIDRKFRAFHPWPGIFCIWNNQRIKLTKVYLDGNTNLIINEVHPAGKKPMSFADFKRGHPTFSLTAVE